MIEVSRRPRLKMNTHDFTEFWHHTPHSLFYQPTPVPPPLNQLCTIPSNDTTLDCSLLSRIGDAGANSLIGDEGGRHTNLSGPSTAGGHPHCSSQGGSSSGDHLFGGGDLHHRQSAINRLDLNASRPPFLPGMMHGSMHPPSHFPGPGPSPLMMNITPGASAAHLLAAGFHSGFGGFPNPAAPFVSFGFHGAANFPPPRLQTPPAMFDLDQQRGVTDEPAVAPRARLASRSGATSVSSTRSPNNTAEGGMPSLRRIDESRVNPRASGSNVHLISGLTGDPSVTLPASTAAFSSTLNDQAAMAAAAVARVGMMNVGISTSTTTSSSLAAAMSAVASNPLNFVLNNIAVQQFQQQHPSHSHTSTQLLTQQPAPHNLLQTQPLLHLDESAAGLLRRPSTASDGTSKTRSVTAQIPAENKNDLLSGVAPVCQVCHSGPSNGLHFGAPRTCAACAAFFRRSISDRKKYVCKRPQRCTLRVNDSQGYRKICRNCRMKRCLEIGMMPEKVQHKRHRREVCGGGGGGAESPFSPKHGNLAKMERNSSDDLVHSPAVGVHRATPTGGQLLPITPEELARQHYANQIAQHQQQQLSDQLLHSQNSWSLAAPMSLCNGTPRL